MTSQVDHASSPTPTMPSQLTLDVEHGTGTTKSVLPAPTNGPSTQTKFASPFLISVLLTTMLETVLLALKDMTSQTDHVSFPHLTQ
jgi:hypothetical protein